MVARKSVSEIAIDGTCETGCQLKEQTIPSNIRDPEIVARHRTFATMTQQKLDQRRGRLMQDAEERSQFDTEVARQFAERQTHDVPSVNSIDFL